MKRQRGAVCLFAQTHLQLPPQATLTAADTVHDPGDVFKVEAELLLREKHGKKQFTSDVRQLRRGARVAAELSGLTFSVLASILWPANMDFSSKCIGKALGGRQKAQVN